MMLATVDWTSVLVVGVPACIASIGSTVAAVYAIRVRRDVMTPSGDSLGAVAERTHDITHATNVIARHIDETVTNGA